MGNYTNFSLEFEPQTDEVVKYFESLQGSDEFDGYADYLYKVWADQADTSKFYYHEKVMKEISKKFPDIIFSLKGLGEENDDMWIKYFKDGKMQVCRARITFDEYDENKLS